MVGERRVDFPGERGVGGLPIALGGIANGRRRAVIEGVAPEINGGRFPIKRVLAERVVVEADIFLDGHDSVSAVLKYRPERLQVWSETPMRPLINDRWRGEFMVAELGIYLYTIEATADHFQSWRRALEKKLAAGQDVSIELLVGAGLLEGAAGRANAEDAGLLRGWASELRHGGAETVKERAKRALDDSLAGLAGRYPDRSMATTYDRELRVVVDPVLARCSAWYELFPRSTASEPGKHGTFKDCERHLHRIAEMGFNILYLPPIHPIGRSLRKGKNNSPVAGPDDPGSPWAIGASEGGHKSVHPELGTLEDFRRLVSQAREVKIEIALDIALQCAPDHPYLKEHEEWFLKRPDGTIQYAENPPKKYQDIYPFNFESSAWRELWLEIKSIFEFWIEQGVTVFRVDNPHTKAFPFWEWCITELKRRDPELIFLAEAFTRPKVAYRLAKLGFTQSYNYFPWRNSKDELTEYLTELTRTSLAEFFRPNLWTNTPDILPQFLQAGGRQAFMIRVVLAATLGASYGIYGPAFELCENKPLEEGSEEYLGSEKYEIRHWNLGAPDSLEGFISRVNRIRRENPALQSNHRLRFHSIDNGHLIAFTKSTEDGADIVLTVVNLDPQHTHHGWLELPLAEFNLEAKHSYQMHDLVADARFLWKGPRNYVELDPRYSPAHIFRLRQRVRTEQDFDYFM